MAYKIQGPSIAYKIKGPSIANNIQGPSMAYKTQGPSVAHISSGWDWSLVDIGSAIIRIYAKSPQYPSLCSDKTGLRARLGYGAARLGHSPILLRDWDRSLVDTGLGGHQDCDKAHLCEAEVATIPRSCSGKTGLRAKSKPGLWSCEIGIEVW
jgi:hypothetical protein